MSAKVIPTLYQIEHTYLGLVHWEQALTGLGIGEGGDQYSDHDWCWDVQGEACMMVDCVGDLTGYLV
jgi:hypothetical protein